MLLDLQAVALPTMLYGFKGKAAPSPSSLIPMAAVPQTGWVLDDEPEEPPKYVTPTKDRAEAN